MASKRRGTTKVDKGTKAAIRASFDDMTRRMDQRIVDIADNEAGAKFGVIAADAMVIACSIACTLWQPGAKVGVEAEFAVGERLVRVGVYDEHAARDGVMLLQDRTSILYRALRIWVEAWAERGEWENQEDWFGGPGPRTVVRLVSEPLPPELRPRE